MEEVKVKKTRKKKVPSLLDSLQCATLSGKSSASKPVVGGEVIVVRKQVNGVNEEVARINPAALDTFAADNKLDARACQLCVGKSHLVHNGYTFLMETC